MEVKERLHKQMKKRLRDAYNTRMSDEDREKARRGAAADSLSLGHFGTETFLWLHGIVG